MFESSPVYFSIGNFAVLDGLIRKANIIFDDRNVSFFTTITLLVLSSSFFVKFSFNFSDFHLQDTQHDLIAICCNNFKTVCF